MSDLFCDYYADFLQGTYDCIDRIVINAYNPFLQSPGGFRCWWRQLFGTDESLDKTHLMRFAGHFSRSVATYARKNGIPVEFCDSKTRKHEKAQNLIPANPSFTGVFCIMVARAPASVIDAERSPNGFLNIRKKTPLPYVNHYSFHIIDKQWGHVTIRFCPHPPFNAMIILNGHEYVERQARMANIHFTKEDNCFTIVPNAAALQRIADTMISSDGDGGRLRDVCERWIYSTCLCFALGLDDQQKTAFRYCYSIYQAEYSRNLLFIRGTALDKVFNGVIDRTRSTLDIKRLKTIFGKRKRPCHVRKGHPRIEVVTEKPAYDLTVFKIHFDSVTLKMYSKGAHVLRIEALTSNAGRLNCGKLLAKFPVIITMLRTILERFMTNLRCVDVSSINAPAFQTWHQPSIRGDKRIAGIDINNERLRSVMKALIALSIHPVGITTRLLAEKVREITGNTAYSIRNAGYDLKKFRAKQIITSFRPRRYTITAEGLRAMAAFLTIRDHIIIPIIAGTTKPSRSSDKLNTDPKDVHFRNIINSMELLFETMKIAA